MSRTEIETLFQQLSQPLQQVIAIAEGLSNEQLNERVAGYGGRETPIRNHLYTVVNHVREHVIHLNKVADATGRPSPTEAQRILAQAAEAMGALHGALIRFTDAEIEVTDSEGQSPRIVIDHVAEGLSTTLQRLTGYSERVPA